jgi:hypothetical protein
LIADFEDEGPDDGGEYDGNRDHQDHSDNWLYGPVPVPVQHFV